MSIKCYWISFYEFFTILELFRQFYFYFFILSLYCNVGTHQQYYCKVWPGIRFKNKIFEKICQDDVYFKVVLTISNFHLLQTWGFRYIESNTGKNARQGNLRHPRVDFNRSLNDWNLTRGCRRFPCLALFAGVWFYFSLLSAVFSLLFDSYVLLVDDHVNNVNYFPFMSIKKVVDINCTACICR